MHYEKELCKKRAEEEKQTAFLFLLLCTFAICKLSCRVVVVVVVVIVLLLCYVSFFTCPTTAGASLKTLTLGQRPAAAAVVAAVAASACGSCNVTLRP